MEWYTAPAGHCNKIRISNEISGIEPDIQSNIDDGTEYEWSVRDLATQLDC